MGYAIKEIEEEERRRGVEATRLVQDRERERQRLATDISNVHTMLSAEEERRQALDRQVR
jgi:hypothetical protein